MAIPKHAPDEHAVLDATVERQSVAADSIETRRARRMAALKKLAGIWASRDDIPADGLEYEHQLRSEWPA